MIKGSNYCNQTQLKLAQMPNNNKYMGAAILKEPGGGNPVKHIW